MTHTINVIVVDNLFERYTILVRPVSRETAVYCDECETWVAQYDGDRLSTQSESDFLEIIVDDHRSDFPKTVTFK